MRPQPSDPPVETRTEQVGTNLWQITLAWSKEALEQASYEMTFGYMAEVGWHVFKGKPMPRRLWIEDCGLWIED